MSYNKKQLYRVTNRLYRELEENPDYIILRKIRGFQGEYDGNTDEISIDYRKMLIPTLIHEYLHKWYPEKCETWILQHEALIINSLSTRQIRNILGAFGNAVCRV